MVNFVCCAFIDQSRTADFQTTHRLIEILERKGNRDDVFGFLSERHFSDDEKSLWELAGEVLDHWPRQGWLTSSLEWRQPHIFERVVAPEVSPNGVERIL